MEQWPTLVAIITIATTVGSSAIITTALTQLAKLPFVPVAAKRYPQATAVGIAVLVSAFATFFLNAVIVVDLMSFLIFAAVTAVVSWKVYDAAKSVVDEIRNPRVK